MTSNSSKANGTNRKALLSGNAFFKRKKWVMLLIVFVLISFFILIVLLQPSHQLRIEKVADGEILWQNEIKADEWFSHEYIHSVERSPVIEKFKLNQSGDILTMESWTKSFGAGLPYERKGDFEKIDGYFVLKDLNRPIHGDSLMMQPSDLFPHQFYFKEEELILSEPPFVKNTIEIKVVELNWMEKVTDFFTS